jgi:hypothetical protein
VREFASFAFSLAGFALFYAALPARRPASMPSLSPNVFRGAGALVFAIALAPLWAHNRSLAFLVLFTGASVAAPLFVLLAPVLPRAMWALAMVSAPVGALLWWGGARAS